MSRTLKQPDIPGRQLLIAAEEAVEKLELAEAAAFDYPYGSDDFRQALDALKRMLQTAIELEHSTIPPYLCALYSIKGGANLIGAQIIRSVVLEEMLHMVMAANLLNSIGGCPVIGDARRRDEGRFIPNYPCSLPGGIDPGLVIGLDKFSPSTVDSFIQIERPGDEPAEGCEEIRKTGGFCTIGEFYKKIEKSLLGLERIAAKDNKTIFIGNTSFQVTGENYYGAGGKLIPVGNITDAQKVINEIVGQGEGVLGSIFDQPGKDPVKDYLWFGPGVTQYAHYFRFIEVRHGRFYSALDSAHPDAPNKGLPTGEKFNVDWDAVYNMGPNPKMAEFKHLPGIYQKLLEFNRVYSRLLDNIDCACNGKKEVLRDGIVLMYELKNKAVALTMTPGEGGRAVGPSFEYIKP